MMALTSS